MTNNSYRLGFAATQIIPPDQVAIIELTVAEPSDFITLHERFVEALTAWTSDTREGRRLINEIDGPVTIGAVLMALDSLTSTSLEHWLTQAGLNGFRVSTSTAIFDLDELLAE